MIQDKAAVFHVLKHFTIDFRIGIDAFQSGFTWRSVNLEKQK